ncbi:hypothetical protein [Halocella sp. SP3-1]|uniref:hypothetical protein n=1 Tax=Halocella sp. SP3-1 TaxID=2382161 RepID=UPI000F753429|nr:hypothetical protein [Halocella sp. SP3-1]AZO94560.1 hypothetical protein D7D81_08115 [Halocella sp. SP3-1]
MSTELPREVTEKLSTWKVGQIKNPEEYGGVSKKGLLGRRLIALLLWPAGLIVGFKMKGSESEVKSYQGKEIIFVSIIAMIASILYATI